MIRTVQKLKPCDDSMLFRRCTLANSKSSKGSQTGSQINKPTISSAALFRTFWVSMVIAILYLGFVALGHIWTTKNLVEPIQELAGAAKWAMEENAAFVLSERGPREVRTLTQTVASFVNSLEEKVRQRTAELEDEVVHRQRAEATVAKANGDLAAKNGDLVAARDEALKGARLKSEFLANMSHEVRTPMNVIIGMTELTLETELQPQQKRQLQMVKDSAESLLRIINDILDFSKIESGKLDLEDVEFNLVESLRDGTHIFSQRAHQKGIDLRCRMQPDVPEVVVGDPGRVRQVITNLVGNAVKFTDEGAVVVAAELEEQNAANVVLHCSVSDSGIGIPKDKHGMIFGDFTQADGSTTRRFGGTGLGLAITRHLVELMGGRIWVGSEEHQGSTFHFTVRLKRSLQKSKETPLGPLDGVRVVVVDPDSDTRRALADTLESWGMEVAVLDRGTTAVELLRWAEKVTKPFSVAVISEDALAKENKGLIQQIKQYSDSTDIQILLLGDDQLKDEDRRMGVADYLTRPVSQSQLFEALMGLLDSKVSLADSVLESTAQTEQCPP